MALGPTVRRRARSRRRPASRPAPRRFLARSAPAGRRARRRGRSRGRRPREVAVGSEQRLRPDADGRRGEDRAIVRDVDAVLEHDVALLAREEGVPPEHARADVDAVVGRSLGVQHASVVDGDVVADPDLPRVPQHDVRPETDVPAARSEDPRIEPAAQHQAERAGNPRGEQHDELVAEERPPPALAHDEVGVALGPRASGVEQGSGDVGESVFHLDGLRPVGTAFGLGSHGSRSRGVGRTGGAAGIRYSTAPGVRARR